MKNRSKIMNMLVCTGIFLFPFFAAGSVLAAQQHHAARPEGNFLASPVTAIISPDGGRLFISQEVNAIHEEENSIATIVIPQNARNLQLDVPGQTIIRWNKSPVGLENNSTHATRRSELEKIRTELSARVTTAKARIAVWQSQTNEASAQELAQRQQLMQEQLPGLIENQRNFEKELEIVLGELAEMPINSGIGQRIEIILAGQGARTVTVNYSYDISSCGWTPLYDFDATPSSGSEDMINVNLSADVWQYSGIDWINTQIILATKGNGPREPEPLRKWFVGGSSASSSTEQKPAPQPKDRAVLMMKNKSAAAVTAESDEIIPQASPVIAQTDNVYASWALAARGLPEGSSRMLINSSVWNAPLEWLSRPSTENNSVWVMAKYTLPQDQAWPAGYAQYSIDGINIGEGAFTPERGQATLYFGADPRVTVHTTVDTSREGETGFINASRTWTGAWTYTISNMHDKAVKVKVERPEPIIGNDNITVRNNNKPEAKIDSREHMIYWIIDVPAHGKSTIQHGVEISSPVKLPLFPSVP